MEIDKTINKWFEQTTKKINTITTKDKPIYNLCLSILPLSRNYCDAVLILLDKNKKLPSMALLRVLGELTLRLVWCSSKDKNQEKIDEIRIKRWMKTTLLERKKYLKKYIVGVGANDKDKIQEEILYVEGKIKEISPENAKGVYGILKDLPNPYAEQLYPLIYGNFNQAIHPDFLLFTKLITRHGNTRTFSGDVSDVDNKELKLRCMYCAYLIISFIRIVYGLDYKDIKEEYLSYFE